MKYKMVRTISGYKLPIVMLIIKKMLSRYQYLVYNVGALRRAFARLVNSRLTPEGCLLQYYCEHCWATIHSRPGREFHKPLVKEGADRPRAVPFRWC